MCSVCASRMATSSSPEHTAQSARRLLLRPASVVCGALLLAHFLLCVQFAATLPALESYDEPAHYAYVRYIAVNRRLPPPQPAGPDANEMHQPPLYYVIAALGISWIDVSDDIRSEFLWGVHRAVRPDPLLEDPAQSGTALAIRVARLVSALLSTIAVWCTYATALRLAPAKHDIALLATAIHAFWPMHVFMGGVVSNDVGIGLAGALVFLFGARLLRPSPASSQGWRRGFDYGGFAVSLAMSALMKDTAVALLAFGAVTLALLAARALSARQPREIRRIALCALGALALLAGSYFVSEGRTFRQWQTAARLVGAVTGGAVDVLTGTQDAPDLRAMPIFEQMTALTRWAILTTFGVFGRGSNSLPDAWYLPGYLAAVTGVAGALAAFMRRAPRLTTLYALFFAACILAAPLQRALIAGAAGHMHGRFTLAAYGAFAIVLALGMAALPVVWRRLIGVTVIGGFGFVSLAAPLLVIRPMYQQPAIYFAEAAGFVAPNPTSIVFRDRLGDAIELIGYELPAPRARRGGAMDILLYWRALRPLDRRYVMRLEGFTRSGTSLGTFVESEPALGTFPTTAWRTGQVYREGHYLIIWEHVDVPVIGTFGISWRDAVTGERLSALCSDGRLCEPRIGSVPIALPGWETESWAARAPCCRLGDQIELLSAQTPETITAGQPITVSLVWRAMAGQLKPLTAFVHLVAGDGRMVAQHDSPPRLGEYPTEVWAAGDIVPDEHVLATGDDLPPGEYRLMGGMYDSGTIERLGVTDAKGDPLPDNLIPLGVVSVIRPADQ